MSAWPHLPPPARQSLPGWCALGGFVVGYDLAAIALGLPTLSAGVQSLLTSRQARWIVWMIGGWVAGHLLIPDHHKPRLIRRSR